MRIDGIYNIANSDASIFYRDLVSAINTLQLDGQEVEVQYSTNVTTDGQLVLSALILGRK